MKNGEERAEANKRIRTEAVRAQLAAYGHHTQALNCIEKIKGLDVEAETFTNELSKHRTAAELHLRMLNKYLPDLKAVEMTVSDETDSASDAELIASFMQAKREVEEMGGGAVH